ncbi:Major facilitator superfamily MFS_1 [Frankia sp. AiPs1]|uniref:MFS transporter n=1 Tax=Frankia sp. AiPa1 TaxID=573492 RepID=UPI00202B120C|nr:MFS transporter [Frankia sp. AiPa1]MCL9760552.1 MFS transporter [Frankia sp. AiPa1]
MSTHASPGAAGSETGTPKAWGLVLAAIVGAEYLLQLDGTIMNVSLPAIQSHFDVSITTGSWILNGFYLAFGSLLLVTGRIGDMFGYRRVFIAGIGLVVVASLLAGLAPNVAVLLVGRVLQGVGAAIAGPTALALLTTLSDGERRQRAFALYSTITALGSASGMVLGGALTSAGSWRYSLLVNVPIGLVIFVVALRVLGVRDDVRTERSLGTSSAALVTAALTAAVYGLVHAADAGWSDTWTIVPLAAAAILFAVLPAVDSRSSEPLLPGRVFAHRNRLGGIVNLLLLATVLGSFLFFLSQYLHTAHHLSPIETGLALVPFAAAILVSAQFITKYLAKVDLRVRGVIGLVLIFIGMIWLSRLDDSSSYATGVLPQIVIIGLGVGLSVVPFNIIVLSSAAPEDTGITAGIVQTSISVGGLIGIAIFLLPFTQDSGSTTDAFSRVFTWISATAVLGILTSLAFWFGPRRRPAPAAAPPAQPDGSDEGLPSGRPHSLQS